MQLINFDFKHFKDIKDEYENTQINKRVAYFIKCFIQLKNGSYCILDDFSEYEVINDKNFKQVYFTKLNKTGQERYKFNVIPRNLIYKVNKPLFYDNNINLCPV